jgi:hypothetical protein
MSTPELYEETKKIVSSATFKFIPRIGAEDDVLLEKDHFFNPTVARCLTEVFDRSCGHPEAERYLISRILTSAQRGETSFSIHDSIVPSGFRSVALALGYSCELNDTTGYYIISWKL